MMTAADTADRARPFVAVLVEGAERATGSRMAAYDTVARSVGVSRSWIRKLLGRQQLTIEYHEFYNIAAAYRSLCERIEADAKRDRDRLAALKGEADAALEGNMGPMVRLARTSGGGTAPRPEVGGNRDGGVA